MSDKSEEILLRVIRDLKKNGTIPEFHFIFADFIYSLSDKKPLELYFSTLFLSYYCSKGNVCIDLNELLFTVKREFSLNNSSFLSPPDQWHELLISCSVVGKSDEFCPLILDDSLLYLHRYWHYELNIAGILLTHATKINSISNPERLRQLLASYFPEENKETNWQRIAGFIALVKGLCIITGGPGTGKTSTIIRILTFLIEYYENKKLRIVLTAPTGKAAARIEESIQQAKAGFGENNKISESIPSTARTIHRLLGIKPGSAYFKYSSNNPLPVDIAVIDEVSMVDMNLVAKFLKALPSHARLILVGDRNQLASVQAGSVFSDICHESYVSVFSGSFSNSIREYSYLDQSRYMQHRSIPVLRDCIVGLKKTYRFNSTISRFCQAINGGKGQKAFDIIIKSDKEILSWNKIDKNSQLIDSLRSEVIQGWTPFLKAGTISDMFSNINKFRTLCVLRNGPYGVGMLNKIIEKILSEAGLIYPKTELYEKLPIMITKNDYRLNLYNGDTGIIAYDPSSKAVLKAWFKSVDNDKKTALRSYHLTQIPAYDISYAISVHKSQGSEFNIVQLILPDSNNPVLTRELLYTGITRTRHRVSIYGQESIFKKAVEQKISRVSGLKDKLWLTS